MTKFFVTLSTAVLMMMACTTKAANKSVETAPAVITWIEDKPGPMLKEHKLFPAVPDTLWETLGLQEGVPSALGCLLLETDGKQILIDAGLGAPFSQLMPKLAEAGVAPDSLSLIYLTHLHPDHIGGAAQGWQGRLPQCGGLCQSCRGRGLAEYDIGRCQSAQVCPCCIR